MNRRRLAPGGEALPRMALCSDYGLPLGPPPEVGGSPLGGILEAPDGGVEALSRTGVETDLTGDGGLDSGAGGSGTVDYGSLATILDSTDGPTQISAYDPYA